MKKSGLIIFLSVLAVSAFGQQALWSTVRGSDAKYVGLNNVTNEVLKLYDQYDYYYDFSGFDKDTFINTFDDGSGGWGWIYDIETMTVIAVRVYIEGGSAVYVVCVNRNTVNMVAFSNVYDNGNIETVSNRKSRFENWFKTLLD
jgi:hypothetical protein